MSEKYYTKVCSYDPNSSSVFERGRKNEFGKPYCVQAAVTHEQARDIAKNLNEGREAWDGIA